MSTENSNPIQKITTLKKKSEYYYDMPIFQKIHMEGKDASLITSVVAELKKMTCVRSVILFGSYARNEQKPLSDIDICIITEKKISPLQKRRIASLGSKKVRISLFWDLPSSVRYAALRDRRLLFNRNKDFFHESLVQTMSEYLDFQHILQKNIKEALEI